MDSLYATHDWMHENPNSNAIQVTSSELARISNLKSPNDVLAVVKMRFALGLGSHGQDQASMDFEGLIQKLGLVCVLS